MANEKRRRGDGGGERGHAPGGRGVGASLIPTRGKWRVWAPRLSAMALRWGIVSAGLICSDFTTVLRALPRSEHQVRPPAGAPGAGGVPGRTSESSRRGSQGSLLCPSSTRVYERGFRAAREGPRRSCWEEEACGEQGLAHRLPPSLSQEGPPCPASSHLPAPPRTKPLPPFLGCNPAPLGASSIPSLPAQVSHVCLRWWP